MGNTETREPTQKRSIEKKKKIIDAGFKLICEKGYHNTNTVEIAKEAGVSTGIVYSYFKDKKDIFLHALSLYTENIVDPVFSKLSSLKTSPNNLNILIRKFIDAFIDSHYLSKSAHEELMAMTHEDEEVAKFFYDFEIEISNKVIEFMDTFNMTPSNAKEKIHIIIGLIENLCHEIVYHKHDELNYDAMLDIVVDTCVDILQK